MDENKTGNPVKPKKVKPMKADGHRERMRKWFVNEGPEHIETHRLLEMLLFYSIPVKDTREQSVALLSRFKTLRGVLEADMHELCDVEGIGKSSALLIKLMHLLLCRMNESDIDSSEKFTTLDSIGKLFQGFLRYEKNETMYIAAFDNARRLIASHKLRQNMLGQLSAEFRGIIDFACKYDAVYIAVGHNHPAGELIPSLNDINFTIQIKNFLAAIDIVLLEHFVCTDDGYYPIIKNRL